MWTHTEFHNWAFSNTLRKRKWAWVQGCHGEEKSLMEVIDTCATSLYSVILSHMSAVFLLISPLLLTCLSWHAIVKLLLCLTISSLFCHDLPLHFWPGLTHPRAAWALVELKKKFLGWECTARCVECHYFNLCFNNVQSSCMNPLAGQVHCDSNSDAWTKL